VVHILIWDKRKSQINEYSDYKSWLFPTNKQPILQSFSSSFHMHRDLNVNLNCLHTMSIQIIGCYSCQVLMYSLDLRSHEMKVDTLYLYINTSVRRGIIWGTSIHTIHKGEVLFISSVYIQKEVFIFWSNCRCAKGGPEV